MKHSDLEKVRAALGGMEAMLAGSQGGPDEDALLEFRRQCWSALLLADDPECQEQVDLLVQYAKEFFAGSERERADFLKGKIRTALHAFRSRLGSIEAGYGKRWRDLRAA
jgi:hypothetical protein